MTCLPQRPVTSADVLVVVYGDAWETMVRAISDRDLKSRRFGREIGTAERT